MIGGRPDWSYACEGCERCINACPKGAIQTSFVRLAVFVALCVTTDAVPLKPALAALLAVFPPFAFTLLWYMVAMVAVFFVFRLVDLALVLLPSLAPSLRPILAFGWTRWFRRYQAPK